MEAVTNATALIALVKIGRLDLLQIFDRVLTTPEVKEEVLAKEDLPASEIATLQGFIRGNLKIIVSKKKLPDLGHGEATAIPLCIQEKVKVFISDDRLARWSAQTLGIRPMGVMGIILENTRLKKISKEEARTCMLDLVSSGLYISAGLLSRSLQAVETL